MTLQNVLHFEKQTPEIDTIFVARLLKERPTVHEKAEITISVPNVTKGTKIAMVGALSNPERALELRGLSDSMGAWEWTGTEMTEDSRTEKSVK